MWASLAKGQIAAQHGKSSLCKRAGDAHQEFRLAIRSRAVGEDQGVAVGVSGKMKEAANRGLGGEIGKRFRSAL